MWCYVGLSANMSSCLVMNLRSSQGVIMKLEGNLKIDVTRNQKF